MRKYQKCFLLIITTLLFCSGCTIGGKKDTVLPNKDLVQGLMHVNQYLLAHSKALKGDVVISATGKGSYEGSNLQINLRSSNEKNSVTLSGNVSSQTALFLIDSLAATQLKESAINLDLVSLNQEYQIGEGGNASGQYLTINEDMLTPFFKTNSLYFETVENQMTFAKGLAKQIVATNTEVIRDKGTFITYTLEVQTDSLSYLLPVSLPINSQKTHVRIVQNQQTKAISHVDLVIYEDKIANSDRTLEFDMDISLQFNMDFEGEQNG